ncbi:MAG: hypothetical protein HY735_30785 [Verrucomicrobia bacterium]|nr:hypothetical protein [Verrucomicrobiota bacterium]
MNTKPIAKLSPGRKKWCVLFRHPKLSDATGRPRRVRYGIGIEDRQEAEKILADLNAILATEDLWNPGAKEIAARTYHPTAVACFYEGIEAKIVDPWIRREGVIELPKDGFSIVQLTGAVGAGKTTLVRQLIGTDPLKERFPATSNARTTIFDTEIICAPGDFHAVVSFLSTGEVRSDVEDCVQAAVMAVAEGLGNDAVARRFLEHSEQKFRLSYILGPNPQLDEDDEDSDEAEETEEQVGEIGDDERAANRSNLLKWLNRCEQVADRVIRELEDEFDETATRMTEKDKDAFLQLVSDKLVDDEDLHTIVDEVVDAIEARFQNFDANEFDRDSSGWPIRWRYQSGNRSEFLKRVRWFASNHAPLFGRLLTPLVEGLRVKGPFAPAGWSDGTDVPPIVLLDGIGLGHSRGTGVQISTSVTRRFDLAHAIVLVDDATKPVLEAAQAFLRTVTASGHERKLTIVFTKLDRMKGDDLASGKDKKNKVLAALDQGILGVETALDGQSGAGRRLRRILDSGRVFFVGGIDEEIGERARSTRKELNALLTFVRNANQPERPVDATPCYDLAHFMFCIRAATDQFQKHWNVMLRGEHWTRIKALSRRFANQWSDEYDTMKPVAHLRDLLMEKFGPFVAEPRGWKPTNVSTEVKDAAVARVLVELRKRVEDYISRRLREEHLSDWRVAYDRRGTGSARLRANDIRSINEDVAPVPDEVPAPLASKLLDDFRDIFREAAAAADAEIIAG